MPYFGELDRAGVDHRDEPALGGRVVLPPRLPGERRETGDPDQAAAFPVLDHVAGGSLQGQEGAVEVHRQDPLELLGRHLEEALAPGRDPGAGEAGVDPAEPLEGLREAGLDVIGGADVAANRDDLSPVAGDPLPGGLVALLGTPPDADARPGGGKALGHAEPDAAVAAGDQRHMTR